MEEVIDIASVWDRLNQAFIEIYGEVLRKTATVRWQVSASENPYHYLMAYAEFQRVGRDDDEGLVLNVGIAKTGSSVVWTTDVCQTRGLTFADGPTRSEPDTVPLSSWIGEVADEAIAWFHDETPNFVAYLNQEPGPYEADG